MNLRMLKYLVALEEHHHFGRAAEACHVSQPTLSSQLIKFEEELGVKLIERLPRGLKFTAAGELIMRRARAVLAGVAEIEDIARRYERPEAGHLSLGAFPTVAPYFLPSAMAAMRQNYPDLEIRLVEDKTDRLVQRLRDGRLDAAILAAPIDEPGLCMAPLFREHFLLAAPESHPLAAEEGPVEQSRLSQYPVLLLEDGHCLRDQALDVCSRAGALEHADFRATSLNTLIQMVQAGTGITLLPVTAAHSAEGLVTRPFADPQPKRDIGLYYRQTSVIAGFLESLSGVLRDAASQLGVLTALAEEGPADRAAAMR